MKISKKTISDSFKSIQDKICASLEAMDGQGRFVEDLWQREGGGGGRTRILQGKIIEKGGVNFSEVHGKLSPKIAKALDIAPGDFYATGVSIVLHPLNPHVPIIHMNIRYFEVDQGVWWFGGGIDLTPHYIYKTQAIQFHNQLKQVCDSLDISFYPQFKKRADDYFYLPHRSETRGIGGIFFDRLNTNSSKHSRLELFDFVQSVGNSFFGIYKQQVDGTLAIPFNTAHQKWQSLRRGRYVEFNLVWDQGTKFGLHTNGRTESILMSLPSRANWEYNYQPVLGSMEEKTQSLLIKGKDWINE